MCFSLRDLYHCFCGRFFFFNFLFHEGGCLGFFFGFFCFFVIGVLSGDIFVVQYG